MREKKLESGAVLVVNAAPFSESKKLYQVFLEETKGVAFKSDVSFFKDMACSLFGSKAFDSALSECMKRCTYNGHQVTDALFESEENRADYVAVCLEVAQENLVPFTKALFAGLSQSVAAISGNL